MKKKLFTVLSICGVAAISGAGVLVSNHVKNTGTFASLEPEVNSYEIDLPMYTGEAPEYDENNYLYPLTISNSSVIGGYGIEAVPYDSSDDSGTYFYVDSEGNYFSNGHISFVADGTQIIHVTFALVEYANVDLSESYIDVLLDENTEQETRTEIKFEKNSQLIEGRYMYTVFETFDEPYIDWDEHDDLSYQAHVTLLGIHLEFTCPK